MVAGVSHAGGVSSNVLKKKLFGLILGNFINRVLQQGSGLLR